jgi:Domain of unknown function (DUF222)/HNH endonuclease
MGVSTLRSALDEYRGLDLARLPEAELKEGLCELQRTVRVAEAEQSRWVAEIERRGMHTESGQVSVTAWVARELGTDHVEAARTVRLARALESMPGTRAAVGEGELSRASVQELVSAREHHPEEFSRVEDTLVDAARTLAPRDLHRAISHWKDVVDAERSEREAEERFSRRGLHVSPTLDGMVRIDGTLDPETGQIVITAVNAVVDDWMRSGGEDTRTPAQRRADALGEICRQSLDRTDRPSVAGERPHLTVTLDLEVLEARAGRRCELDQAGRVTPAAARRLACDASVSRVITTGASEPLDVGRRTPVVPAGLRRAVVIRDSRCRFPGCDRPHTWCDAHHVRHWADGGETRLDNLVLLCRPHHRAVHEGGFGLKMSDGQPVFHRPDGERLEDRGPP